MYLNINVRRRSGASYAEIQTTNGTNTTLNNLAIQPTSGNVGIGTISPGSPLDIQKSITTNDEASQLRIVTPDGDNTIHSQMAFYGSRNSHSHPIFFLRAQYNNNLTWADRSFQIYGQSYTGAGDYTPLMTIKDNGNVGIGTASPSVKLHISSATNANGAILETTADNVYLQLYNTGTSGNDWLLGSTSGSSGFGAGNFVIHKAGATLGTGILINSTCNVGIGTLTPGTTHKLYVVGSAYLSTGTAWTTGSDKRFKNIEGELKGIGLKKVMSLHPISYTWNELHDSLYGEDHGLNYGFIAQEVKEVIPEFITQDSDGYYNYNPSGIEAILTSAIQEQQQIIENQQSQISTQQNQIETQKNQMDIQEIQIKNQQKQIDELKVLIQKEK